MLEKNLKPSIAWLTHPHRTLNYFLGRTASRLCLSQRFGFFEIRRQLVWVFYRTSILRCSLSGRPKYEAYRFDKSQKFAIFQWKHITTLALESYFPYATKTHAKTYTCMGNFYYFYTVSLGFFAISLVRETWTSHFSEVSWRTLCIDWPLSFVNDVLLFFFKITNYLSMFKCLAKIRCWFWKINLYQV